MAMTHHLVLFCSKNGWFTSHEFVGDKNELQGFRSGVSCDESWKNIARKFADCQTLDEFRMVNDWAQGLYHDPAAPSQKVEPVGRYRDLLSKPDDVLHVYEDLSVTGLTCEAFCFSCNRPYQVVYRPNGKVSDMNDHCFSCGSTLSQMVDFPTEEAWQKALSLVASAPATYKLVVSPSSLPIPDARKYGGQPVRICKLVSFSDGQFRFEVLFRDWNRRLVLGRDLEPVSTD